MGAGDDSSSAEGVSVREQVQRDLLAVDLLTSLFWAAATSFRHDTILRPFPPAFLQPDGHKEINRVRRCLAALPPLDHLLTDSAPQVDQQELVRWIGNTRNFTVDYRPNSTFDDILAQTGGSATPTRPQFVFELSYNVQAEESFQQLAQPHGVFLAYHGSAVENFYSIVHNGLISHFNKTAAFGEGTYLSTDVGVCLNWSPNGHLWPKSLLPHTASCVAVCEVIKDPTVTSRVQTGGEPSLQGRVPDKYFIVPNNEHVRVKYVLVFGREKTRPMAQSWVMEHKFVLVLILYLVFLLVLGVLKSREFQQFYQKHFSKLAWR